MNRLWFRYQLLENEVWRLAAALFLLFALVFYFFSRFLIMRFMPPEGDQTSRQVLFNVVICSLRGLLPLVVIWVSLRIFLLSPNVQSVINGLFMVAVLAVIFTSLQSLSMS